MASTVAISRRLPTLFTSLLVIAFLMPTALCDDAAEVRYSITGEAVKYGDLLFIYSSIRTEGRIASKSDDDYLYLIGDATDPAGSVLRLNPTSSSEASSGDSVKVGDNVYVDFFKFTMDPPDYVTWKQAPNNETLLLAIERQTFDPSTVFTLVALPVPLIWPPVYYYGLVSSPSSYSAGLARHPADELTYIRLAAAGEDGDLAIQFSKASQFQQPKLSMSTDA